MILESKLTTEELALYLTTITPHDKYSFKERIEMAEFYYKWLKSKESPKL
jgi:uncharacterized protein (DUF3820 family)